MWGGLVIGEPKTETSKRVVTLPPTVCDELSKHLDQLNNKQGFIFTTSSGKPISPRNLIRHFKLALVVTGLPNIRIQDLHHSHASLLLAAGINPKLCRSD